MLLWKKHQSIYSLGGFIRVSLGERFPPICSHMIDGLQPVAMTTQPASWCRRFGIASHTACCTLPFCRFLWSAGIFGLVIWDSRVLLVLSNDSGWKKDGIMLHLCCTLCAQCQNEEPCVFWDNKHAVGRVTLQKPCWHVFRTSIFAAQPNIVDKRPCNLMHLQEKK